MSAPRIIIMTALTAGFIVVGAQYNTTSPVSKPLHSQTTSVKQPAVTTTPASSSTETTPLVAPAPIPAAPQLVTTASIPHSVTPVPVVTPAPDASVTGLSPVNPTPAGGNSSTTTPDNPGGSTIGTNPTTPAPQPPTTTSYVSSNWSGYLAATANIQYTAISGAWTVPAATATTVRTAYDAAWIGLGGVTATDLIQVGTMNTVSHGHETSSAFYELFPQSAATPINSLTVTPGDNMSASVARTTTGQWSITITDTTTGKSFTTNVTFTSSLSSAEWIEEDLSSSHGKLLPLDNFAPVAFTGATLTASGSNLSAANGNAQPITLISNTHQPLATPSVLGTDGQSFTVTHAP